MVEGYIAAAPVTHYEISIDGGEWFDAGLELSYNDVSAPANVIHAPVVAATQGSTPSHVSLGVVHEAATSATSVSYRVRAVNDLGASDASPDVSAGRTHGPLQYQWQRSTSTSATDFIALSGAQELTHNDTTAPSNGAQRYYRLEVSASGAQSVYSDSVVGFRAALSSVSTLAASNVTMTQATIHGALTVLGVPAPGAHGFCYSTQPNPALGGSASCIDFGAVTSTGTFQETISGLAPGTEYFVRAYAVTNAGIAYGNTEVFWTVTEPPAVRTSVRPSFITVSWNAVTGAEKYIVQRDGEDIAELAAPAQSLNDTEASPAPPPGTVEVTSITNEDRTDGVLIEWNKADVSPGTLHVYSVIAVNPDNLPSAPGSATGQMRARPLTGYEIKVGSDDFFQVDISGGLQYHDADAPLAQITPGPISATQGYEYTHVVLESSVASVSQPEQQTYIIRARNSAGAGLATIVEGRRGVSQDYYYQWSYSDVDTEGPFDALFANPALADGNYDDSGANADGSDRYYYVEISIAGAQTYRSDTLMGYRAAAPMLSTQNESNVEKYTATLHGTVDVLGRPDPAEHGFCYGTMQNPSHTNGAICTTLGAIHDATTFQETISGLSAGTQYYVRSYAIADSDIVRDPQTVYGNQIDFWTTTEAPTGLATSVNHHDKVALSWNSVVGAARYLVFRDGNEIADLSVQSLHDANSPNYDDFNADAAPAPNSPVITAITKGGRHDGVLLEWEAASVDAGTSHQYHIVAVNPDGLESDASSTEEGEREARPVTGYELNIGAGGFVPINPNATNDGFEYFDASAPKGIFNLGYVEASDGSNKDSVDLISSVLSVENPATQTYSLRAVNPVGPGAQSDDTGFIDADTTYYYQWFASATGAQGSFHSLFNPATTTDSDFSDTTAPANGDEVYYFVRVSGDGIETKDSDVVTGFKAVFAEVSTQIASDVSMGAATLNGVIDSLGKPDPTEHGFCWGTMVMPSIDDQDAHCEYLGATSTTGAYHTQITNLTPGTQYFVRAFAITNAGVTEADTATHFWTTPEAPSNVVVTSQINAIRVDWHQVDGAARYAIYRQGPSDPQPVYFDEVHHPATTFVDTTVEGGTPHQVVLTTPEQKSTGHVLLEWTNPGVADGDVYTYGVIAINADNLESDLSALDSTAAMGAAISDYELEIDGSGNWGSIGNHLFLEDTTAPLGILNVGNLIKVGYLESFDEIELESAAASFNEHGAVRSYKVRAVHLKADSNPQLGAASNSVSSNRIVNPGSIAYQWQRATSLHGVYEDISVVCATSLTCQDSTAVAGELYYYRMQVTADGAETVYSSPQQGALNVLSLAFNTEPQASIVAGESFTVSVQLMDADDQPYALENAQITLTLNNNTFASGLNTASALTDVHGVAVFNSLNIEQAAQNYVLTATSSHAYVPATTNAVSENFDIIAAGPDASYSTITGTSGANSDGVAQAAITITIKDAFNNPVAGETPTFSASAGDNHNEYLACGVTGANGQTTCQMRSTWADSQTLQIEMPVSKAGGTISFNFVCTGSHPQMGNGGNSPFTICNAAQLNTVGTSVANLDYNYVLLNDIDLNSLAFNRIGTNDDAYTGNFDGGNFTVSNLTINTAGTSVVGMFGKIDNGGKVHNLILNDISVHGNGTVGGVVGDLVNGSVDNVAVKNGQIQGSTTVGGLVGISRADGLVVDSYSHANVSGGSTVGGLVGSNNGGTIETSYVVGEVVLSAASNGGPVVGANSSGTLTNVYFNSNATCTNCTNTTGTSRTFSQMRSQDEAQFGGFDFSSTWTFAGCGTPYLLWEDIEAVVCVCDPANPDFTQGPGDGSAGSPYLICSADQLNSIGSDYNTSHFKLTADIDLSSIANFNRIAASQYFFGSIDGNGHVISNLTINEPTTDQIGLIARFAGKVTNLGLKNVNVTGRDYVGGIVGSGDGSGKGYIENSFVTGSVSGRNMVGGIIGRLGPSGYDNYEPGLYNLYAVVTITVTGDIPYGGGLAGISTVSVENSFAIATIAGPGAGTIYYGTPITGTLLGTRGGNNWSTRVLNSYRAIPNDGSCVDCNDWGTARTMAQMNSQNAANFTGFDFTNDWKFIGCGHPRLIWEDTTGECN